MPNDFSAYPQKRINNNWCFHWSNINHFIISQGPWRSQMTLPTLDETVAWSHALKSSLKGEAASWENATTILGKTNMEDKNIQKQDQLINLGYTSATFDSPNCHIWIILAKSTTPVELADGIPEFLTTGEAGRGHHLPLLCQSIPSTSFWTPVCFYHKPSVNLQVLWEVLLEGEPLCWCQSGEPKTHIMS